MNSLLNAPILAFFLGIIAVLIHSDLAIPRSIGKFISLYLLFSIGFRGGTELAQSIWYPNTLITIAIGLVMSIVTPLYVFAMVKKKLTLPNAGAIAASYGSISVVTFITAASYLSDLHISYGGHMVALMTLMECPAIMIGILLIRMNKTSSHPVSYASIFKEVFTNRSILILLGGLIIGFLSNPAEIQALHPFVNSIQKGMLVFFLLDIGLLVGRNIKNLIHLGRFMIVLGIAIPIINATIGVLLAYCFKINLGDSLLLVTLLASASYIAVPASFKLAVPEADPSIYLTPTLAITFPFNVIVGIPLYYYVLNCLATL